MVSFAFLARPVFFLIAILYAFSWIGFLLWVFANWTGAGNSVISSIIINYEVR